MRPFDAEMYSRSITELSFAEWVWREDLNFSDTPSNTWMLHEMFLRLKEELERFASYQLALGR